MILRLENLTLGYDRYPAVHHLSGTFAPGRLTAVIGPNGAGKSTLLKGIKGLLPTLGGRIALNAEERGRIAYLPQQAELEPGFPISVLDVVLLGHWRRTGAFGTIGPNLRRAATAALEAVGLPGFERRGIGSLSLGQRQRVLFARLMLEDGPAILLDEPFAAIDARTIDDLMAVVCRWGEEGRTVIAVLHDLELVRRSFPFTLMLAREAVAWGPTETVLVPETLERLRRSSETWDENAALCRREYSDGV
ncbi:metal ABC transporter ATP-binding protein [Magnetospirillum molischianum]|uniref:Putative ABC transporter (ATP-binding protein) n=1 Tax=Magnetospirillum molischianum DSM 120 TaxID=1150626 RepID=H8FMK4_MAGML|nr:ABC transporter ATP-binding protein [Magnetospirillum molischianum]CCG39592.1 Putative ABC transporter (ATP-binding protein) [Magnetospirillum molischianum DSM 120]